MKQLIASLLLVAASCQGQDASGITNKVTEIDRDKDGLAEVRIETLYRGKSKVMMTVSRRTPQKAMAIQSRSYLADGKLAMVESDDDGDGTLESITVFGPDRRTFEMFIRESDGIVRPVSTARLDSIQRQKAVADAALRKLLEQPDQSGSAMRKLLEQTREKTETIQKENKGGS